MVDYPTFVGIVRRQCGSDFDEIAQIWNAEKQTIKSMSAQEVRSNLTCP